MNLVSTLDQLEEVIALGSRGTLLLGGELVYVTSDASSMEAVLEADAEELVQQPPRIAARGGALSKAKPRLHVAVSRDAIQVLAGYRGTAYLLADQYLAYGLSVRSNCIIIGGGITASDMLNLEVFVFTGQRLVQTVERTSQTSGPLLDLALQDILRENPEHQVHWCAPLPPPPICDLSQRMGFLEAGQAPLKTIVRRKIFSKPQATVEPTGWFPAMVIAGIGAGVLASAIVYQWARVTSERAEYQREIAGYEEAYQNSSQSLDLLRHRDFLLKADPAHAQRIAMVDLMLRHVAQIQGVVIEHVRFYDENDMRSTAMSQGGAGSIAGLRDDFSVEIMVPADEATGSARDQAEPLLAELNFKTGMTIRVIDHGAEKLKIGEEERPYWRYRLGGTAK